MERNTPEDITERRYMNLRIKKAELLAQLTEVDAEMQRVELGQKPHDLSPVFGRDRFWVQTINFDESYRNQASQQEDAK